MNKNIVIGLLVAVVVIAGGYYLFTAGPDTSNQITPPITQNPDNNTTPPVTNPAPTVPPLTLGSPTAITNPNVSVSISTALVNGQLSPNGIYTTYWYEYGETTNLGTKTSAQQIGSGFSTISAPAYINNLRSNTLYYFRLSANNNLGDANGTMYSFTTNSNPAPKASMPIAQTNNATSITRDTANLIGQISPKGWQTNYWFEYGKDNKFGNTTLISSVDANPSLSYSTIVTRPINDLAPLTKYYFRLNAQNQFGTVNGSTLSFTTKGPLNPGVPTVTTNQSSNISDSSVRLNGHINPNGADTIYWFEYSTNSLINNLISGNTTPEQKLNAGTDTVIVQANVNNLHKSTKYYSRLISKNQYGTVYGDIVSFTTKP